MRVDRRTIVGMLAAAAGSSALGARTPRDPIAGWTVINALGGLDDPNRVRGDTAGPRVEFTDRIIADSRASGQSAVTITLGYVAGNEDPYTYSKADIALWDAALARHPNEFLKVRTAADIVRARRDGKVGVIYGFQNGAMLGDDAARVDEFAAAGVRIFQLTYNPANRLGGGSMAPETTPLTEFGREVIARVEANRAMVDLSHSGRRTCLDAIAASTRPLSINHTGCRALINLPRNKTDTELRAVAEKGGFVGIYFMPFLTLSGNATAAQVVAHIEHAIKVCGEECVGIGSDNGTTSIDDLGAYAAVLRAEHADRKAKGIAAPGEGADILPFVEDLRGPDQFRKLARLLEARGHRSRTIEKVLGLNFLNFARRTWA